MAKYLKSAYDEVKSQADIKTYVDSHLTPMGKTYICPICGSGTGPNKSPAFSIDTRKQGSWKCFSCGNGGNILDLVGFINNTQDGDEQLEILAREIGYDLNSTKEPVQSVSAPAQTQTDEIIRGRQETALYIQTCKNNLSDPDCLEYLASRNISLEDAFTLGLGFDPNFYEGKDETGAFRPRSKRLIIPYPGIDYYYAARDITDEHPKKYRKPYAAKVGAEPLFNASATESPVFVACEGQLDCLAITACGIPCVSIGGTGAQHLLDRLNANRFSGCVIIALDNDEAGATHAANLSDALSALGIANVFADGFNNISDQLYKDPDELRAKYGISALHASLTLDIDKAAAQLQKLQNDAYNTAMERLNVQDPAYVAERIFTLTDAVDPIPTGFNFLDQMFDGGIRPGSLIALGALSSMGKTTLVLNIADNVASQGYPVLFVSIEQRATELVAKSLSAIMKSYTVDQFSPSSLEIRSAKRRSTWSDERTYKLCEATNYYTNTIAPNLRILEGNGRPKVEDIANIAAHMTAQYGIPPLVIIDYLQLLAYPSERDTDKTATDKNVLALRQLAGGQFTSGQKLTVIVISSINRTSYNDVITLESFKESGAVEYGADILLGLQPNNMEEKISNGEGTRCENARKLYADTKNELVRAVEVTMLKNRGGRATGQVSFLYNAVNDRFRDVPREAI